MSKSDQSSDISIYSTVTNDTNYQLSNIWKIKHEFEDVKYHDTDIGK